MKLAIVKLSQEMEHGESVDKLVEREQAMLRNVCMMHRFIDMIKMTERLRKMRGDDDAVVVQMKAEVMKAMKVVRSLPQGTVLEPRIERPQGAVLERPQQSTKEKCQNEQQPSQSARLSVKQLDKKANVELVARLRDVWQRGGYDAVKTMIEERYIAGQCPCCQYTSDKAGNIRRHLLKRKRCCDDDEVLKIARAACTDLIDVPAYVRELQAAVEDESQVQDQDMVILPSRLVAKELSQERRDAAAERDEQAAAAEMLGVIEELVAVMTSKGVELPSRARAFMASMAKTTTKTTTDKSDKPDKPDRQQTRRIVPQAVVKNPGVRGALPPAYDSYRTRRRVDMYVRETQLNEDMRSFVVVGYDPIHREHLGRV